MIVQEAFILVYQRLVLGAHAKPCEFAGAAKKVEILVAASVMALVERRPVAMADALHDGLNEARDDSAGDHQQPARKATTSPETRSHHSSGVRASAIAGAASTKNACRATHRPRTRQPELSVASVLMAAVSRLE